MHAVGARGGRRHVFGAVLIVVGLGIVVVARLAGPGVSPALYDGVVPTEPYRYLSPGPGQPGNPEGATATEPVTGRQSPLIAIATPEQPPQAQVFAAPGSFTLPAGTTSLRMSIEPITPTTLPTDGVIAGNVYRIRITDQAGTAITAPSSAKVTVVLRGPGDALDATMEESTGAGWQRLKSEPGGMIAMYLAVVTQFGDFALVEPGVPASASATSAVATPAASSAAGAPSASSGPSASSPTTPTLANATNTGSATSAEAGGSGLDPILLVGIVTIIALLAGFAFFALRRAQARRREAERRRYRGAHPLDRR